MFPALRPFPILFTLSLLVATPAAHAITVGLNSTVILPGTTFAQRPDINGTSLAPNTSTVLNQSSPTDTQYSAARLNFDVLREPAGGLLFTYRPENLSTLPSTMTWSLVVPNLPYSEIDADVLTDSPGTHGAITISRDAQGTTTFTSDTPLSSGQSAQTLFISLPWATTYRQEGGISLNLSLQTLVPDEPGIPGLPAVSATGYSPLPEPSSALLVLLATSALTLRIRRVS